MEVISDDPQAWGRSYEKEVKEYLTARINELIGQLQLTESKAVTFYDEVIITKYVLCYALHMHNVIVCFDIYIYTYVYVASPSVWKYQLQLFPF